MKYVFALIAAAITFLVYLPDLGNEFVNWDDNDYVYDNFFIQRMDTQFFRWAFSQFYDANWHPLTWVSHGIDYSLWGLNALGHHLSSNILHALNAALTVFVVRALLDAARTGRLKETVDSGRFPSEGGASLAALVTGLLFGLHPLHVESVAWVSERKDLLCAFFFLLALLSYIRYVQSAEGRFLDWKSPFERHYLFAGGLFALALLSKPMAVSFPVVLLLLDWYPLQRIRSLKTAGPVLIEKAPFFLLSLVSSVVTVAAQRAAVAMMPAESAPLPMRVLIACKAVVSYLAKMVMPVGLSPFYPYPKEASLFSPHFLVPLVVVLAISAGAVAFSGKQKLWLTVWMYYLVTLFPVLGVIQVGLQSMADRYTYLPSLGPFLVAGLAVSRGYDKIQQTKGSVWTSRIAVVAPCALVLAAFSCATVQQIAVWKTSLSLWDSVIRDEPGKVFFAYMNRGIAYEEKGQYDLALADYGVAAVLNPASEKVYNNRAIVMSKIGDPDRAIEDCNRALSINPRYAEAYNNRGIAYALKGLPDKAIEDYSRSLAEDPYYLKALVNRGNALAGKGLPGAAIEDYTRALATNPQYANAYLNRGLAYYRTGNAARAVSDLQRGCLLGNESACRLLGGVPRR